MPLRIGALAPLSPPGWVEAGRHLLAGLELGVRDVNAAGGTPLELVVRDTAANPERAAAAVEEFARMGVAAVAGEYHSVAARGAAARAEALGLPYLCSSAVLDALTDQPAEWVARLPPPQSQGWRVFADFLLAGGHRRVAVAADPSVYWAAGTRILRDHFAAHDGIVIEPDDLAGSGATALVLLVGTERAVSIVHGVRRELDEITIGAPAGQPEFAHWLTRLGADGAGVPFLRYLPERLTPAGARVEVALGEPSFVAFEGYDTITVLADVLRSGTDWSRVAVDGTRGRIEFVRGESVWQSTCTPIQVADRDPARPERFRIRSQDGTMGAWIQ